MLSGVWREDTGPTAHLATLPRKVPVTTTSTSTQTHFRLLLGAVFVVCLSQMALGPIIAPLAREVGLAEWQVGITISTAALTVVVTSQKWGRTSQSWGRKPVLVAALGVAAASTAGFAVVASLGMAGVLVGTWLFIGFVVLRGIGFGAAVAAMPPTAQAYIADVTDDEETRVKGMAALGAVQASSMIAGAAVGGVLSAFGLLVPLVAIPCLLVVGLVLVVTMLRREPRTALIARPARVNLRDQRIFPYLACGFGMMTALGFVQVITGFVVQDRLGLGAADTGALTGAALAAAGCGLVVAQTLVVRRVSWSPPMLIRTGTLIAASGFGLFAIDLGAFLLFAAMVVIGLGLGIAMPGYVGGPTLLVSRQEQGGLAGLIGATNGLTFVLAPTLSTILYESSPGLPAVIGGVLLIGVCLFSGRLPRSHGFTAAGQEVAGEREVAETKEPVHDDALEPESPDMPIQRGASQVCDETAVQATGVRRHRRDT